MKRWYSSNQAALHRLGGEVRSVDGEVAVSLGLEPAYRVRVEAPLDPLPVDRSAWPCVSLGPDAFYHRIWALVAPDGVKQGGVHSLTSPRWPPERTMSVKYWSV
jgi:hypothetical protein